MIFTASYFQPENHRGLLVPISRGIPKGVAVQEEHPLRSLLAPPQKLLTEWNKTKEECDRRAEPFPQQYHLDWYTSIYREHIRDNYPKIKEYVLSLDSTKDETWLCWERAGEFCHRNLAIEIVRSLRPDCFGGMDVSSSQQVALKSEPGELTPEQIEALKAEVFGKKEEEKIKRTPLIGKRVKLKFPPHFEYEVIGETDETKTSSVVLKLASDRGRVAFWYEAQVEVLD